LSSKPFPGFPDKTRFTPLPDAFFTTLLHQIGGLAELKLILHVFWLLYQKKANPKFVSYEELLADKAFLGKIEGDGTTEEILHIALESAIGRGVLLHLTLDNEGEQEDLYFINSESNRKAIAKLKSGEITFNGALPQIEPSIEQETPNIFTLYEQNIGLLTPMIAEELREAEKLYPVPWIEDAFKEAVSLNKRNWRYIARILERWSAEGKESGEFRRDSKEEKGSARYLKGKYGHLVRR